MQRITTIKPFAVGRISYLLNTVAPYEKGVFVLPVVDDENSLYSIIDDLNTNKSTLMLKNLNGIYTPMNIDVELDSLKVRKRLKYKEINDRIITRFPEIKSHKNFLRMFMGRNIIFNSVAYNDALSNRFYIRNEKRLVAYVDNVFDIVVGSGELYNERYIIVPLDYANVKDTMGFYTKGVYKREGFSFAERIIYYIKFYPTKFIDNLRRSKSTLVFYSNKGVFKISYTDMESIVNLIGESANVTDANLAETTLRGIRKINETPSKAELENDADEVVIEDDPEMVGTDTEDIVIVDEDSKDMEIGTDANGDTDIVPVSKLKLKKSMASQYRDKSKAKLVDKLVVDIGDISELEAADVLGEVVVNDPTNIGKIVHDAKRLKAVQLSRTKRKSLKEKKLLAKTTSYSVEEELSSIEDIKIEPEVFHDVNTFDKINENKFMNMNKTYEDTLGKKDQLHTFTQLSENEDFPLYLSGDMKQEDISDKFNNMKNLRVPLKDMEGNRMSVNVDIPKLEGNIMYINGNKYELQSQRIVKPIVKFGAGVMLTMNYNKAFVDITGKYLNHQHSVLVRFFNKFIKNPDIKGYLECVVIGVTEESSLDERSIMFADISKYIREVTKDKDNFIYFKLEQLKDEFKETYDTNYKDGIMTIGKMNGELILLDVSSDMVTFTDVDKRLRNNMKFADFLTYFIRNVESEDAVKILDGITTKVTKAYSIIKILSKKLPIALILAYTEGLDELLKRADVEYRLEYDAKKPDYDKTRFSSIQFEDCYLIYKDEEPEISLLMSSLQSFDFSEIKYVDVCDTTTGVLALMISEFSNGNLPLYISSFKTSFVDHISKDILLHYDLPSDFCGVLIYANNLLASDIRMKEDDATLYRIRNAECIQVALYKVIADAYGKYVIAKKRGAKNAKLEVSRNAVIREIQSFPNVNTYSTVNPVVSADSQTKVTMKGPSGLNMDRAFTVEKRSLSISDTGVSTMPSAYTGAIGIVRRTPIDPKVVSLRGYIESTTVDKIKQFEAKELLSPTELITPGCTSKDDPQRVAMNMMQKGHMIGTRNPSPMNITNGYDEMLGYFSKEFAFYAEKNGVVKSITDEYVIVAYDDGTEEAFKLKNVEKHSAKAKLIDNDMNVAKGIKVGAKLKAKDPIAYNKRMFVEIPGEKLPVFCMGQMKFVAFVSAPEVYEDSCILSESTADSLSSYDYKSKAIVLPMKTIIKSALSSVDIKVNAGDPLIRYITSTGDTGLDDLSTIESDYILTQERNVSHAGTLVEIRVAYCCKLGDMSSSLKRYVDSIRDLYNSKGDNKIISNDKMDKFKSQYMSRLPQEVKEGTKVAGKKINKGEVVVEYVTKSYSRMGHADKVTVMSALKGETSRIYPDNLMPKGIESGIQADMMMSPTSPYKRKVFSFVVNGATERLIYELCASCREILDIE